MDNLLNVRFGNIEFKNPVIAASGTFGLGFKQHSIFQTWVGFAARASHCTHEQETGVRIWETASGIMNSVGLENKGVDLFIKQDIPALQEMRDKGVIIIANVSGSTIEEYVETAALLDNEGVDMIELNISCPNVKEGGIHFGMTAGSASVLTRQVRNATKLPLIIKLSPNADNIVKIAQICEDEGADGLSLINTFKALAIDINKRMPIFDNIYAGLSGQQ